MPEAHASGGLREATILVVDDEPANTTLLARILARGGFNRVHTTNEPGRVAGLHRELAPDLIILDVHMPGMSGFEVLETLRAQLTAADYLPVLAVTGDADPSTRERIIQAGAKDFLVKPFEMSEVLVRVHNLLTTRALHASLRRFLSSMSHELRTPLNAVIGFAQQLGKNRHGTMHPTDLEFARRIAENGTSMLRVVDDLLERSRLQSERMVDGAALGPAPGSAKH